jgi:uncharacterized membrane protein YcjF (UPF0283 family)
VVSLLILAGIVALAVSAESVRQTSGAARWLGWALFAGMCAVFLVVVVVSVVRESRPHRRQARRLAREQEREKRRRLENFELE